MIFIFFCMQNAQNEAEVEKTVMKSLLFNHIHKWCGSETQNKINIEKSPQRVNEIDNAERAK